MIDEMISSDGTLAPSLLPSCIPSPVPSNTSANSKNEPDSGIVGHETHRWLVEWWNREYCAGRMRLCIVGNVSIQTVKAFHAIEISFPLVWQSPLWWYKPAHFISHFTGHEGPGSLFLYLKNKGWVTLLSSCPQTLARVFEMFKFTIHLTKLGFENYQLVALATYKYLSLLRSSAFPKWYQLELVKIENAEGYAVSLSKRLGKPIFPLNYYCMGQSSHREVHEILEYMHITKGRAVLMAKKEELERISKTEHWEHKKWYGMGYRVERWDPLFVEQASIAHARTL
ncbi:Metalloenzyme, LuxS/M16 peptidase-like protein [Suillus subluteus]|nr:Metalloenzyme, LuxS/M16 peptidase-like protein [Suillus subluteus]